MREAEKREVEVDPDQGLRLLSPMTGKGEPAGLSLLLLQRGGNHKGDEGIR